MGKEAESKFGWVGFWTAVGALGTVASLLVAVIAIRGANQSSRKDVAANASDGGQSQTSSETADPVSGTWAGQAVIEGSDPFDVEVKIREGCAVGETCGTIYVSSNNCTGILVLKQGLPGGGFEFDVTDFTASSGPDCNPGPGEFLTPEEDDTLTYTTDYNGVTAKLTRQ
jgi:hypothetical protein